VLPAQPERRAARHEHLQRRHRRQQIGDDRGRSDHLLEVVEDDERAHVLQVRSERIDERRLGRRLLDAQRLGDRRQEALRVSDLGEVDEVDVVRRRLLEALRELDRKTGLPRPARAGERHEAHLRPAQKLVCLGELLLAAEKPSGGRRQARRCDASCGGDDDRRLGCRWNGEGRRNRRRGPCGIPRGGEEFAAGSVALRGLLRQRRRDDNIERGRQIRSRRAENRRGVEEMRMDDGDVGLLRERRRTGEALVENAAERVHVDSRVERLALDLLGRRVVDRAEEQPRFCQTARLPVGCDAEVGEEGMGAARLDQDVRGLHVTVDEIAVVRGVERGRSLLDDRQRLLERQPAAFFDHALQIVPVDVTHRDVEQAVGLAGVVDRDDVRVFDRGNELRLANEAFAEARVFCEVGWEDLDRCDPRELIVARAIHPAHRTSADLGFDGVSGESCPAVQRRRDAHRAASRSIVANAVALAGRRAGSFASACKTGRDSSAGQSSRSAPGSSGSSSRCAIPTSKTLL
jgi:hypothetical protein